MVLVDRARLLRAFFLIVHAESRNGDELTECNKLQLCRAGLIKRTVNVGGNTYICSIVNIYNFTPPVAGSLLLLPRNFGGIYRHCSCSGLHAATTIGWAGGNAVNAACDPSSLTHSDFGADAESEERLSSIGFFQGVMVQKRAVA